MAANAIDREVLHKRLKKLNQKFLLIEKYLDGPSKLPLSLRNLKKSQQILRRQFYDLLAPFYEGNILSLDFHELPDLVFPVVVGSGTDKEAEFVVLAQRLEVFEKLADEKLEVIYDFRRDLGIVPKRSTGIAITESDDKKRKLSDFSSLADDLSTGKVKGKKRQKVEETQESQETEEADNKVSTVTDIAVQLYGFTINIATDIEDSLHKRNLVQDYIEFEADEAEIGFDEYPEYGKWQEGDAELRSWVMVKKLKTKFEELKKELYKTEEADDQNAEPKVSEPDIEDPESNKKVFLKVIRNWIFHIESVLFHLVYEILEMMSENEASETIFQEFLTKLKMLKEVNNGMVPITVYKVPELIKDPFRLWPPRAEGSDNDKQQLHEKIRLSDVMDLIHGIMERLRTVLVTASLTEIRLLMPDVVVSLENILKHIEEELREIKLNINGANSGPE